MNTDKDTDKDIVAITSLLDPEHTAIVTDLIDTVEEKFGLRTVKMTPYPHVTWLTVEGCSVPSLKEALADLAEQSQPFTIQTTGIGMFPGPAPVIYIPVLRTQNTNLYHDRLYRLASTMGGEISPYYHPSRWMPHITLALGDTTPEKAGPVMEYLNHRNYNWQVTLDNIALLTKTSDKYLKDEVYMLNTALAGDTIIG